MDHKKPSLFILLFICCLFSCSSFAVSIKIVAAENFYGSIAKEIGGNNVSVVSIMSNPNQDPHLFNSNFTTAKAITNADLVIYNGLDYDPWMKNLLVDNKRQQVIVVANLLGKHSGENPHIWYDPKNMQLYARILCDQFNRIDPNHKKYYEKQYTIWKNKFENLNALIHKIHNRYKGLPILATEPVFNYMGEALGFKIYGEKFQLSVMNNTEPSISSIKDFEARLRMRQVKFLIYNNQVTNPLTNHMRELAKASGVAVIGISELQPSGEGYFEWMQGQLEKIMGN